MRKMKETNITNDKINGKSGKERGVSRILCVSAACFFIFLCGCTRREQLVLETVSGESDQLELQTIQEQDESGGLLPEEMQEEQTAAGQTSVEQIVPEDNVDPQTIYVHVCGAVENPDVYELPAHSRVYEAVQAAGGFTEEADCSYVNQAQKLSDGVKLVIPTLEQTQAIASEGNNSDVVGIIGMQESGGEQELSSSSADADAGAGQSGTSDVRININTASEAELCNIPGIGAVRAAAIVAYRQEKGGFASVEDIMNVSGIKEGTYDKIKDSIKVD